MASSRKRAAERAPRLLHPTAVLFNGGVMKADALRGRLVETLDAWLAEDGARPVRVLEGADLDLAVARGACAYALVRRGKGLRIRGGTARAYYVGIESAVPAVPGIEPPVTRAVRRAVRHGGGDRGGAPAARARRRRRRAGALPLLRLERPPRRPGRRLRSRSGRDDELDELPPIEITLPAEGRREGDVVPVRLRSRVTEVGTLLLEAEPVRPLLTDERWRVELSVRGG